ncbi:MAG: hydantoinase/oxoprolinase family protein [Pseudomonadota bacterium]
MSQHIKCGIDIGGTFTDAALELNGDVFSTKVLTTHSAPDDGIIASLRAVCAKAGVQPQALTHIIHGTTLATNALIERRGAKTAFITTKGFRDVIEMRTESRFEQYDLDLKLPPPLLARNHRYTVDERISAQGETLRPLAASDVDHVVERVIARGYESIAIGLLHAYAAPAHERMIRDALLARAPDLAVSLSSEVSPQMREYERFNTVCANAYVQPMIKGYLSRLGERLAAEGCTAPVFLMHSGGGIISLESAAAFPVRLVESGPAGGAIFAANIAQRFNIDRALSFDMGGTTAKICLIQNRTPKTSRVFEVARTYRFKRGSGMPISIPVIDMVEIGAGGGSLAHVDAMRQIRVGPASAGSEPGPACYARGGEHPAVTDADLVLGRLDPDDFAGGSMQLDAGKAEAALSRDVGTPLDLDAQEAAFGVCEVVDETMANAARVHAVENGEDPADYTMIAFGGAAPLHAGRLCDKLGISRLLVPPGAGVGSAIGFLRAPFGFEATRSLFMRLDAFDPGQVRLLLEDLRDEAVAFVRTCDASAPVSCVHKIYMRYSGQGWEIPITLTPTQVTTPTAADFLKAFETAYRSLFGRVVEGLKTEITVWAANATTNVEPPTPVPPLGDAPTAAQAASIGLRTVFDPRSGTNVEAPVHRREDLATGCAIIGPAVITEAETTIIVPSAFRARAYADGTLEVARVTHAQGEPA